MASTINPNLPTNRAGPARAARAVSPHDDNDLSVPCRSLYVGTGGDVAAILRLDDQSVIFRNVPDGGYVDAEVKRVLDTGTTADDILALY